MLIQKKSWTWVPLRALHFHLEIWSAEEMPIQVKKGRGKLINPSSCGLYSTQLWTSVCSAHGAHLHVVAVRDTLLCSGLLQRRAPSHTFCDGRTLQPPELPPGVSFRSRHWRTPHTRLGLSRSCLETHSCPEVCRMLQLVDLVPKR